MQSVFQYRRLRRQVEKDLALSRSVNTHPLETSAATSDVDIEKSSKEGSQENLPGQTEPDQTSARLIPGVQLSSSPGKDGQPYYIVGWAEDDRDNPQQWAMVWKWMATLTCCILSITVVAISSIEGPTLDAFDEYYNVNPLAGSTATTGIFLVGIGFGSLFAGPFSETFGRNIVYFVSLVLVIIFTMAKALAPNYGAALVFRLICALFAATPMTVAGGTVGDVWLPIQLTFGLPSAFIGAYTGPILGPIISAWTPVIEPRTGFKWADWISMIMLGFTLIFVLLFQPETYGPTLLEWRAAHLRALTGDARYRAAHESSGSLTSRFATNLSRPFLMVWTEPIILVLSFYLILLYFVLFTFLDGYTYIFTIPYGISNGLTFTLWVAMLPGIAVAAALIPLMHHLTKKAAARAEAHGRTLAPEVSLYWGFAGSWFMPISLFWMAWTCYPTISIWVPLAASLVFGYALVCIFVTAYLYVVFVYGPFAASALGFMTFSRYVVAGALVPASVRMYEDIGPHWALTISAVLATLMAPVPFVLYRYGPRIRAMSRNVQVKG